jgi:hypothetical protein
MSSTRCKVIWSILYILLVGTILMGTLYLFHRLLKSGFGVNPDQSFIFVLLYGIILFPPIVYGCYGAIRVKCFGESLESRMGKIERIVPHTPKALFWFLAPLLFTVFAYMYSTVLNLAIWIVASPFGRAAERYSDFFSLGILAIAVFFALATIIGLWQGIK